ncbi:MAG TPA: FAD-dependent oxidoreductase [Anaerolineae bacterium]|nr:FAD-dependent oxidoreductase [Anaerolineae bacterium]HIQ06527.1 FAD-dependent oxidoreductase [Anaerolineae bacterium]
MDVIYEPARETPILRQVEIAVIGGGPAGLGAAIAAARMGREVVLVERYGHLGGLATGGLVLLWDDMDDGHGPTVGGIAAEMLARLEAEGGAVLPPAADLHRADEAAWWAWAPWGFGDWHVGGPPPWPIMHAASVDAEALKRLAARMVQEAGAELWLHRWAVGTLTDGGCVTGVLLESKGGRGALCAQVTVDTTGDGDVFAAAGAEYTTGQMPLTLAHRLGGVDVERALALEREDPEHYRALNRRAMDLLGATYERWWLRTPQPGVVWCNCPTFPPADGLDPAVLTQVEVEGRERIARALEFLRAEMSGFEAAYLLETAPQVGVRQTRLLRGEAVVTREDLDAGRHFADSIGRSRTLHIPYRALVPRAVDGLLVAGRCYSATPQAQALTREIAPCLVMGQAAGVAAALAVETRVAPRAVDVARLQDTLRSQGAIL